MIDEAAVGFWGCDASRLPLDVGTACQTSATSAWVADSNGTACRLQWSSGTAENEVSQDAQLCVTLSACGHASPILSILDVPSSAQGQQDAVLTVDASGRACLWQEASGMLLRAAQLPVQPAAGIAVLLPGAHHAALPCHLPGLSADGSAVSRAVEQQGFAVIHVRKLALMDVAIPASLLSLQKFWNPDHQPGRHIPSGQPRVVAAKILVSAQSEAIIVSLTETGDVLTYLPDCPPGPPTPDACLEPTSHPHHATTTDEASRTAGNDAQLLTGPLVAAAFATDGQHILLAAETHWMLLHAPLWEVRGPPHLEYIVSSGGVADMASGFGRLADCCMFPVSTRGECHWALCSTTSAVTVFRLHPDSSSCAPAQQPAAIYLPAPGAAVCSTRLLLAGSTQLAVLCSHSPATRGSCHSRAADAGEAAQLKVSVLDAFIALAAGKQPQQLQPVRSATLLSPSTAEDAVTQQLLAGGDSGTPHLLVQGWQCGSVSLAPIASVAAGDDLRVQLPCPHSRAVTCLMQHRQQPAHPQALPQLILLSGAADGTVKAWSLAHDDFGKTLFTVTAHSGAVAQIKAMPAHSGSWQSCVLSSSKDGIVCVTSLVSGRCERVLPGHPVGCNIQMAVDARRGYLFCLCTGGDAETVAIVWDLHSGVQDRTFWGVAAHAQFDHVDSSTSENAVGYGLLRPHTTALSQGYNVPEGVLIHSVAVRQLLATQTAHSADVALALALLHLWGVNSAVDSCLRALLAELELLQLPQVAQQATVKSAAARTAGMQQRAALLPAMISNDAITISVPVRQQAAAAPSHQHQQLQQEAQQRDSSTGQQHTLSALLEHSPVVAAHRVLAIAALAHRLQADPQPSQSAAAACSALLDFVAIDLHQGTEIIAAPPLDILLPFSQDLNVHVREAARMLLRARRAVAVDSGLEALPPEASALLRLPEDSPGGVVTAAQLQQHAAELLVAASVCLEQPGTVPPQLLAITASGILGLACAMPAPHGAEAAALLAQALSGPCAASWRPHLGSLRSLTDRLFEVCARNGVGTARPPRRLSRRSGVETSPLATPLSMGGSSSPFSAERPSEGHALDGIHIADFDTSSVQGDVRSPQPSEPQPHQQPEQQQHQQEGAPSCRDAAAGLLPALALFDLPGFVLLLSRRLAAGGTEASSPTHLMSFLALLRLAHSHQGLQALAAHLPAVVAAVLRALSELQLRRACLHGVTMVVQELCRQLPLIDFQNTAQLLAVGVPGLQVATGSTATGLAGAAGLANAPQPPGRSALLYDMQSGALRIHLVTAHDLATTGSDARRSDVSALAFDATGARLAALSVLLPEDQPPSAAAGRTAAKESVSGIVRVWALELGFAQRLQQLRGPVPIEPVVCRPVALSVGSPVSTAGSADMDLRFQVKWQPSGKNIAVMHAGKLLTMVAC